MASISTQANGHRIIQFVGCDRKRRSLRLGKVAMRHAESVRVHVEHLVAARVTGGAIHLETARWLTSLTDELHAKLAGVGLIAARDGAIHGETLGGFLDRYFAERRVSRKPGTLTVWGHTRRCLVDYFGATKSLKAVTAGDADAWREHLLSAPAVYGGRPLSINTVRRRWVVS